MNDLKISLPEAPDYPDFYILSQADILAISNSTYSAAAAMLNTNVTVFMRPGFEQKRLVQYAPWNSIPFESWHQ